MIFQTCKKFQNSKVVNKKKWNTYFLFHFVMKFSSLFSPNVISVSSNPLMKVPWMFNMGRKIIWFDAFVSIHSHLMVNNIAYSKPSSKQSVRHTFFYSNETSGFYGISPKIKLNKRWIELSTWALLLCHHFSLYWIWKS